MVDAEVMAPARGQSGCGCLLMPLMMGALLVGGGVWLMQGWEGALPVVKVLAVILVVAGSFILLAVGTLMVVAMLMIRLARGLKRDMQGVGRSVAYMMRMGRPPTVVDVNAVDVQATPASPPESVALPEGTEPLPGNDGGSPESDIKRDGDEA